MDGKLVPGKFTGVTTEINKVEIDRRALEDPQFELTLDTELTDNSLVTGNSRTISVRLVLKANKDISAPLIAHVALVEDDVTVQGQGVFKNVLRQQLFESDGETVINTFLQGDPVPITRLNIEINTSITDPSKLKLFGFVQDKNSKEIYQSIVVKAPEKDGALIVGVKDNDLIVLASLKNIQIFPNPANREFNFAIPGEIHAESQWEIIDQRGVSVLQGDFSKSNNGLLPVDVSVLSNAMYYVVITGQGGTSVRKKLMVMNRN
jgi:Secretion system C-terminal sorting domain